MADAKKFCIHSDGLGYCDILSDGESRQYCVEGPCPHEEIAEYAEVVHCRDCTVPHNKWTGCPRLNGLVTPPDFYCGFGERESDEMS